MNEQTIKNRNRTIDIMRIICTCWIVFAWHYTEYCADIDLSNPVFLRLTFGILATFFWISGYVADINNLLNQQKYKIFLIKKFERILPLFILSAISMFAISMWKGLSYIKSLRQFFLTIFFVAPIVGQAPSTLWYVNVLGIYYILLCCVHFFCKKTAYIYYLFGCTYCVLLLLSIFTCIDSRIVLYFMFFIWGYVARIVGGAWRCSIAEIILASLSTIVFVKCSYDQSNVLLCTIGSICFIFLLRWSGMIVERIFISERFWIMCRKATYPLYLFHRQIYVVLLSITGVTYLKREYLVIIIPLMTLMSCFVQECDNYFMKRIKRGKKFMYHIE